MAEEDKGDAQHLLRKLVRFWGLRSSIRNRRITPTRKLLSCGCDLESKAWRRTIHRLRTPPFSWLICMLKKVKTLKRKSSIAGLSRWRRAITGYINHLLPQYLGQYAHFLKKLNRDEDARQVLQRLRDIQAEFRAAAGNLPS